jgi:SAM-dependent methyltransferase
MSEFDQFSGVFEQVKELAIVKFWERPSVLGGLGDGTGLRVLDLGCGTGYYSRLIRERGAAEVVGVDISAEMIDQAVQREQASPLGITYHVMDAKDVPVLGAFDIINVVYTFCYAPDEDGLRRMMESARRNLKPGGRLFAITANADFVDGTDLRKYGCGVKNIRVVGHGHERLLSLYTEPLIEVQGDAQSRLRRSGGRSGVRWPIRGWFGVGGGRAGERRAGSGNSVTVGSRRYG